MTLYDTQSGVALDDSHEKAVDAEIANLEAIRAGAQGRRVPISIDRLAPKRELATAVAAAYRQYLEQHHGDLSDPESLAEVMFNAGSRNMADVMVAFSGIVPQLQRIEDRVRMLRELLEIGL